jgi:hypothetical protein
VRAENRPGAAGPPLAHRAAPGPGGDHRAGPSRLGDRFGPGSFSAHRARADARALLRDNPLDAVGAVPADLLAPACAT